MSHIVAAKVIKPDMLDKYGKYVPYVLGTAVIGGLGIAGYYLYKKFGEPVGDILGIPSAIVEGITDVVTTGTMTKEDKIEAEKTLQEAYDLSLVRLQPHIFWNAFELVYEHKPTTNIAELTLKAKWQTRGEELERLIEEKEETLTLQDEINVVMSFTQAERDAASKAKSDALAQMQANIDRAKAEQDLLDAEQRSIEEQRKIDQAIEIAEANRIFNAEKAEIAARERDRQIAAEVKRQSQILIQMNIDEQFKITRLQKIEDEELRVEVTKEPAEIEKIVTDYVIKQKPSVKTSGGFDAV